MLNFPCLNYCVCNLLMEFGLLESKNYAIDTDRMFINERSVYICYFYYLVFVLLHPNFHPTALLKIFSPRSPMTSLLALMESILDLILLGLSVPSEADWLPLFCDATFSWFSFFDSSFSVSSRGAFLCLFLSCSYFSRIVPLVFFHSPVWLFQFPWFQFSFT